MDDRLQDIDRRLHEMDATLADVVRRLDCLEGLAARTEPLLGEAGSSAPRLSVVPATGRIDLVSLTGRTLIVLGGAFLLRALTDSGQVPIAVGTAAGLAYAVGWLVFADRAAGAGRMASSVFHGLAATIIGLPLVWEASTRFALFGTGASATAVGLLAAVSLVVAIRHEQQSLAGIAASGAVIAGLGLAVALDAWLPFLVLMVVLGAATWLLGERFGWTWLRWPPAIAATLLAMGVSARAGAEPPREAAASAIASNLLLVVVYLGTAVWRTLGRAQAVRGFDVVMAAAAIAAGLGGALAGASSRGLPALILILGLGSLFGSSMAYGIAVAIVRRRQGRGVNYVFYTSVGLTLLLIGGGAVFRGSGLTVALAGLAIVSTLVGSRATLPTFTLHGAILAAAAVIVSGLAGTARLWVGPMPAWPALPGPAWIALTAVAVCLITPRPARWDDKAVLASVGRGVLTATLLVGGGTAVVVLLGPRWGGTPPDPGGVASFKTSVLAIAAVLAAVASRVPRLSELRWFVYPVLVAGGLQLLGAFGRSDPAVLFVALGMYGTALVLAPRLRTA